MQLLSMRRFQLSAVIIGNPLSNDKKDAAETIFSDIIIYIII